MSTAVPDDARVPRRPRLYYISFEQQRQRNPSPDSSLRFRAGLAARDGSDLTHPLWHGAESLHGSDNRHDRFRYDVVKRMAERYGMQLRAIRSCIPLGTACSSKPDRRDCGRS